jgi:PAS domain S-box-containing protein
VDDAIEVIDPATGRFLDMNEKGCHDLGYSREEILSTTVPDIKPSLDLGRLRAECGRGPAAGVEDF